MPSLDSLTVNGWAVLRIGGLLVIALPCLYMFSKWLRGYVGRVAAPQQGMILGQLVYYGGLALILATLVNELGFSLTPLLGAAGIVGVAVGFASQTSISNIVSGVFLMAEQSFVVGDVITVGGVTGEVLSVDLLSVKLRTFDNMFVRIPNESIIKSPVTNLTRFPIRRVDLKLALAPYTDLSLARKTLLAAASANSIALRDPEPLVIFSGWSGGGPEVQLAVWGVKSDWLQLRNQLQEDIQSRFAQAGISFLTPVAPAPRPAAGEN